MTEVRSVAHSTQALAPCDVPSFKWTVCLRKCLKEKGNEVIIFHAVGSWGAAEGIPLHILPFHINDPEFAQALIQAYEILVEQFIHPPP